MDDRCIVYYGCSKSHHYIEILPKQARAEGNSFICNLFSFFVVYVSVCLKLRLFNDVHVIILVMTEKKSISKENFICFLNLQ